MVSADTGTINSPFEDRWNDQPETQVKLPVQVRDYDKSISAIDYAITDTKIVVTMPESVVKSCLGQKARRFLDVPG